MIHGDTLLTITDQLGLTNGREGDHALAQRAMQLALRSPNLVMNSYSPVALQSVLANLAQPNVSSSFTIAPQKLNLDQDFFPGTQPIAPTALTAHFSQLKKELESANRNADLVWLRLEQYGTSIACHPSFPDISLFDFVRVSTAFAVCLKKQKSESASFVLIGGAIAGIQKYLYDIISKGAAKLLKGRSFYLQLLTDSLVERLLHTIDLSPCNVLYASGGGFYVLAPDTSEVRNAFNSFTKVASNQIFAKHKNQLFIDLALSKPFDSTQSPDIIWDELMTSLATVRWKRLGHTTDLRDQFLSFSEFGGTRERDEITNQEIKDGEPTAKVNELQVLEITKKQIELGRNLRQLEYYVSNATGADTKDIFNFQDAFGTRHYFPDKKSTSIAGNKKALNHLGGDDPFLLYGGNDFPAFDTKQDWDDQTYYPGEPKPYDYLSEGGSFDRLGVLRMDVDGLGTIFSEKMSTPQYSLNFARYAVVSRSFDWFFKGYLNTIWKNTPGLSDRTVIIYSGGDDLFIVGRWKETLAFAKAIRQEFSKWVCNNPVLSISGGIAIVTGKFPLMQAAKLAEEAEDNAKNYTFKDGNAKNAFTLMDMPLHWKAEFDLVEKMKNELLELLHSQELNKSFLGKIGMYHYGRKQQLKDGKPQRWLWTMAYDFSRFRDREKNTKVKALIEQVMKDAFSQNCYQGKPFESNYHYLELMNLACRWAELEHRTKQ